MQQTYLKRIFNEKLSKIKAVVSDDYKYKLSYEKYLQNKVSSYHLIFNTLPPDPRLIIPKLGINVHIVTLSNVSEEIIKKADYDKYLYSGVVKYPYTPNP
jgi:hypothetical protein